MRAIAPVAADTSKPAVAAGADTGFAAGADTGFAAGADTGFGAAAGVGHAQATAAGVAVLGRRGFVGAITGAIATAAAAMSPTLQTVPANPLAALPGELSRRAGRTAAGTAYDAITVEVHGARVELLLPRGATPTTVTWLLAPRAAGTDGGQESLATALSGSALDTGTAVLRTADPSEEELVALSHWLEDHARASGQQALVIGVGSSASAATMLVRDRLVPRTVGLLLVEPVGVSDFGRALYWRGRRLRVIGTAATIDFAETVGRLAGGATEASTVATATPAREASATLRRWLAG